MINGRMKLYNLEVKQSGQDAYGQPLTGFIFVKTVEVSVSLIDKVINSLDPRYINSTHIGLSYDKTLNDGMRITSIESTYMVKLVNNDGRMSQLTLEMI